VGGLFRSMRCINYTYYCNNNNNRHTYGGTSEYFYTSESPIGAH
jgi:hypothetical protein